MESGFAEAFDEHRDPSLPETDALRRWKLAVVVVSSLSRWRMKKNSFAEASDEHRDLYLQETDVLRRWKLAVVVVGSRSKWRRKKIRNELDISVSIAAQLLHSEQIKKHVKRDNEPDTTSWRKGSTLGSGSYGTVYEATDANGFSFAIKEVSLLDQGSRGNQSIDQLEQEIALLGRLEHENIVQYYGTKKDELKLYIFLELVTPGSLLKVYQKSPLRDSQVSEYTRQILHGLKYLHDRNVVHRDIKCANILVDENGCVKIADFGLAKAIKFNDLLSCKGTAHWMAPELVDLKKQQYGLAIYRGRLGSTVLEKLICPISNEDLVDNFIKQQYGLAADIWSLGCTVLEMSSGQIPYAGLEWQQALFEIGKGRPPPIPDFLSNDAKDFIQQCLRVEACDRPTAAELLEHPFVKKGKRQKF